MSRLKEARKAAGMTQVEVSQAIGLSQGQYSAWENGRSRIDSASLSRLAELFHVTADYLLCKSDQVSPGAVRINVLGTIPAGVPVEAVEDIEDWEEIPAEMCSGGREYFALRVKGDSMWPDFLPGDVVIVRKTPMCNSGDVCVVYVNGYDATLKQVQFHGDGSLSIVPKNQEYPPRTFNREEIENLPVSIAGVVVELRRRVNGK